MLNKILLRNLSILGVSVIVLVNLFVSLSSNTSKNSGVELKLLTALASEYGGSGSGSGGSSTEMYTHMCSDFSSFSHLCEQSNNTEEPCNFSNNQYCGETGHTNYHQSGVSVAYAKQRGCINNLGNDVGHRWVAIDGGIVGCEWCGMWYDTADPATTYGK